MTDVDFMKQIRENQARLAAVRCPVETDRPAGWQVKEQSLKHSQYSYERGNPVALLEAVIACRDGELPLPEWLANALKSFLVEAMTKDVKGSRGKGNSFLGEARKAYVLHERGATVWSIRQVQKDRENWRCLQGNLLHMFLSGQIVDFGKTEDEAFRIASVSLRGTDARGEESTMRKAYRNYRKCDGRVWGSFSFEAGFELGLFDDKRSMFKIPDWLDDWVNERPIKT